MGAQQRTARHDRRCGDDGSGARLGHHPLLREALTEEQVAGHGISARVEGLASLAGRMLSTRQRLKLVCPCSLSPLQPSLMIIALSHIVVIHVGRWLYSLRFTRCPLLL